MSNVTVAELIDDRKTFKPEVIEATKVYARSKPWQGTAEERQTKLRTLHVALCAAYGLSVQLELVEIGGAAAIGHGGYSRRTNTIVIARKVSVVTYLHLFTKARGCGPRECFKWSLNLFKRCFPRSFANAQTSGPWLLKAGTIERLQAELEAREAEGGTIDLPEFMDGDGERDDAGEL